MGALKSLQPIRHKLAIIGIDRNPWNYGTNQCDQFYQCPSTLSEDYLPWLKQLVKKQKIDAILPTHGIELEFFDSSRKIFEEIKVKLLLNNSAIVQIGIDKYQMSLFFKKNKLACPETILYGNKITCTKFIKKTGYPIIAKPRFGFGSRGIYLINSTVQLKSFEILRLPNYVLQKYIATENDEYTVGIYVSKFTKITHMIILKRILKNGSTVSAEAVEDEQIRNYVLALSNKLNAAGHYNVQLRKEKNTPFAFEVNPKLSGTTSIRTALGFNDTRMLVEEELFEIAARTPKINKFAKVIRFTEDFLIPMPKG